MNKLLQYGRNVVVAAAHFVGATIAVYQPRPGEGYWYNFGVGLDEFGNAVTGGDPGETISSRAAKARNNGRAWGCVLCKFLNVFQKDHCTEALSPSAGSQAVIPDGE